MILERAFFHPTAAGRNGQLITRECARPDHVRQTAQRLQRWAQTGEACQLCQGENAVAIRAGKAVCGICRANMETRRAAFDVSRKVSPQAREDAADGLSGLAIAFDSLSVEIFGFFERIASSAVDRTFTEGIDVVQLAHHNSERPLASLRTGTLRIRKTPKGLANAFTLLDTTDGRDMLQNVRGGIVTKQSFGFVVMDDGDEWAMEGERIVRTVHDMRIYELSGVVWPAYTATALSVGEAGRDINFLRKMHQTRMAR